MKVIVPGHRYALETFEKGGEDVIIQFLHKEPAPGNPGNPTPTELETIKNGTTNEEVLAMLINRMKFLHKKLESDQSAIVIMKLEEALMWLNHRTAERKRRGVEGTHQK